MEAERFDRLARVLAGSIPRRRLLRLLAAGLAGGAVLRLGREEAAARCLATGEACRRSDECCPGAECAGRLCRCRDGFKDCGGGLACRGGFCDGCLDANQICEPDGRACCFSDCTVDGFESTCLSNRDGRCERDFDCRACFFDPSRCAGACTGSRCTV